VTQKIVSQTKGFPMPVSRSIAGVESRVKAALEAMKSGIPVVLLDDFERENEADLVVAAEMITEKTMALLIRECSGIVCLCLPREKVEALGLKPMVTNNQSRNLTAFTVSIEAASGISTGVSARDRMMTIQAAISAEADARSIVSPGHVFPLMARDGGVLERRGHTEGSVDLASMAGLMPASVICELMNPDGTMAVGEQVIEFAKAHELPMLSIEEHRRLQTPLSHSTANCRMIGLLQPAWCGASD
jgi:3,4-dihydroxy 2-butanone 4-phosphate synthase